jgi:hypothetical protein
VFVLALLLLFFAQVMTAAMRTSLTSDEGPQVTSGYAYLKTGDMHLIEFDGHPPLAKVLNALPLMLVPDLGSPAEVPSWDSEDPISLVWVTQEFLYPYRPLDRLVVAARVPVMLWGIVLAALVYRWATDLFGPVGGLGALVLVVFDPNLLAHAGLATNDIAVTTASLAALFTFWRFMCFLSGRHYANGGVAHTVETGSYSGTRRYRKVWGHALLAGVTLGIAQSTKLNALLLLPAEAALALIQSVWQVHVAPGHTRGRRGICLRSYFSSLMFYVVRHSFLVWLIAGFTLWASYGFEFRTLPIGLLSGRRLPVPAGTHLYLWERVLEATGGGHPSFLMGEISTEGWWHYFPVAFMIKTPLPTLFVLLGAGVVFIKRILSIRRADKPLGYGYGLVDELTLLSFIVLYGAATVVSRLNIGYRHLLPILPLLYIFAARLFSRCSRLRCPPIVRGAGILLAAWLMVGTLKIWPFHLAFFNELVGGPDQGYRYLVDSNTDWGQALKALHTYLEREQLSQVRLSTYIEYDAAFEAYGLADIEPLPPLHAAPGVLPSRFSPAPGIYVISTTTLQGIFTADPEMYDWFRKREPDARIGHVMFLYDVSAADSDLGCSSMGQAESRSPRGQANSLSYVEQEWIAQCTVPVAPLSPAAIAEGFGHSDFRHVYFDCTQSWLVPAGGRCAGWYVLFRDTAPDVNPGFSGLLGSVHSLFNDGAHIAQQARGSHSDFIVAHLEPHRLSFEQTRHTSVPPFAIYEAQSPSLAPAIPVSSTIRVGGLTFLGHSVVEPLADNSAEVWTYWQVVGPLPDRPLSLMLHLVISGSDQVVVGDGLGVPVENWRIGDVIVQRHTLSLPMGHEMASLSDHASYEMYTGAYWLDTLERWPVSIDQVPIGDQVPLLP